MIYENEHSLNTERAAITKAAEIWNTSVVKLPRKYSIDFALLRDGEVKAWVEFKSRTNPIGKYPTYTVSLYKYTNLLAISRDTGIPAFFIVEWTDTTRYLKVPCEHGITFSGRKDRGDWEDMEPMVEIDTALFLPLKK